MKKKTRLLWVLIVLGFAAIEFPGIFFINRAEPFIFGLPFIYGFTLIIWFILCVLMYVGYRLKWGYEDTKEEKEKTKKTGQKKRFRSFFSARQGN